MGKRNYLVADIGGTNALVELITDSDGACVTAHAQLSSSAAFAGVEGLIEDFLHHLAVGERGPQIDAACLSVAGPVRNNATTLTNLGWRVDGGALAARFGIPHCTLINDFAAVGAGIAALGDEDLITLQRGEPEPHGNRLVVGAGTGLGVGFQTWQNDGYTVHASEAGHVDFAPTDAMQDALLSYLRRSFNRVSYERVVSGPGLPRILSFLEDAGAGIPSNELLEAMKREDAAAAIAKFGSKKLDPLAARAFDMFVEIYGAFVGNMALAILASGGIYIAGGVARRNARKFTEGGFIRAFGRKGRFSELLSRYPVYLVVDSRVGLKGALAVARAG